ncbi:hypothetical protein F503_08606 [Ophiostoma piceae UAMH 11346]|uniref:Methyltransferase domain-containing protein n=1 Tax=Ophiostoma piceae (strain UAMH 11346) TaxID=1262450 RepID=S3BM53_OPHP1|nr:hypothetical protein F503_08606 [Ophiostoma piceae UAMH 11346]
MPRLPLSLFWRARRVSPGAALLLPVCRDLPSALLEFGWIKQHVESEAKHDGVTKRARVDPDWVGHRVLSLCRRRGRDRWMLTVRPEPEAYSMYLAERLLQEAGGAEMASEKRTEMPALTVLDACTGTGCIALLLYAQLRKRVGVHVVGVDIASEAIRLAQDNAIRNGLDGTADEASLSFVQCNLFSNDWLADPLVQRLATTDHGLDVLVSNPPYISTDGFARETARSVRIFEPKLAQVPLNGDEDVFYHRLLDLAARLNARTVLYEVGSLAQAERVVAAALSGDQGDGLIEVEIWADSPDIPAPEERSVTVHGRVIPIRGSGYGRSVFLRRR